MTNLIVSGAYGRDYKSKAAALAAWADNKDFIIRSAGHGGRYINKTDADAAGLSVEIRYAKDRKVVIV